MGSNREKKPWPIYKTHTKIRAKRLRAKTFDIAVLEKLPFLKGNTNYFAF